MLLSGTTLRKEPKLPGLLVSGEHNILKLPDFRIQILVTKLGIVIDIVCSLEATFCETAVKTLPAQKFKLLNDH